MKIIFKLLLLLAFFAFSACAGFFDSARIHTLKMDDGGATCRVGDTVVLSLDSNPATGYDWTPVSYNSAILKLKGRTFAKRSKFMRKAKNIISAEALDSETLVGAPGVTEISFVALHPGESDVSLEYSRPWEGKPTSEAIFKIKVVEK